MKVQIVDKDDNFIELKDRFEVNYDSDIYRVSALWLTNSEGKVLLAKRAMTKKYDPGMWGPAAVGTLEENETYENNIYKEAEEEIGLTGVNFEEMKKILVDDGHHYFIKWYKVVLDKDPSEFTLQQEEVDEVAWFDIDIVKKELTEMPDKYVPALPQIVRDLGL